LINILELEASKGWGGQEKRTVRLANNLPKDEVTIVFAANEDSYLCVNQAELGIEVIPVKMRASWDMIAVFEIINIIHARNIDIVVTHSGRDGWLGGIAAKMTGKKCVRVRHLQTPFANISWMKSKR
jgi:L-malate glycosyltransferase